MHDTIANYGYPALFLLSFLAATLLPIGSEWLLVAMILQRHDPFMVVAVATAGNYLGACTSYAAGLYGGKFLTERVLRIGEKEKMRAEKLFARYGSWSLLFSWLPVIGDPLCLVGGFMEISFARFSIMVATGKLGRYAVVTWLSLKGVQTVAV